MRGILLFCALLLATAALPAVASAADPVVAADPGVALSNGPASLAALDGTIVWVSSTGVGHETLKQRSPGGAVSTVKGAPEVYAYQTIDLGHDEHGKLVLTYLRCSTAGFTGCKSLRDDLHGHRSSVAGLAVAGCVSSTGAAMWGTNAIYGMRCDGSSADVKRTGLYLKAKSHAPRRLKIAREIKAGNIQYVESVDLVGSRYAVAIDGPRAFSENLDGSGLQPFLTTQDGNGNPRGLSSDRGGTQWVLTYVGGTDTERKGIADRYFVTSHAHGCRRIEELPPPGLHTPGDIAVDATKVYLAVAGVGIVRHTFAPAPTSC